MAQLDRLSRGKGASVYPLLEQPMALLAPWRFDSSGEVGNV